MYEVDTYRLQGGKKEGKPRIRLVKISDCENLRKVNENF